MMRVQWKVAAIGVILFSLGFLAQRMLYDTLPTDPSKNKYFHEASGEGEIMQLEHYDGRYFHGIVSPHERQDTQLHMIRAYLEIFGKLGLETWLAHGSLLGWWWNRKTLPWDLDLDVQISDATLQHLAQGFNQTIHVYSAEDGMVVREYLLDVNAWYWERTHGDGANVIDARWIDVRNGLFIDITGLSEADPKGDPGVLSCKNFHRYRTIDLFPLRETMFEGVPAMVPRGYAGVLMDEYTQDALLKTEYEGHRWDAERREWVVIAKE